MSASLRSNPRALASPDSGTQQVRPTRESQRQSFSQPFIRENFIRERFKPGRGLRRARDLSRVIQAVIVHASGQTIPAPSR